MIILSGILYCFIVSMTFSLSTAIVLFGVYLLIQHYRESKREKQEKLEQDLKLHVLEV